MIISFPWKLQKWSFFICSVPVALVADKRAGWCTRKVPRKQQQPSTVFNEQLLPTLRNLFAHFSEMARVLLRQNL